MSIDLMFSQANAAYRAGDFAGAERRYKALTRLKPTWAWHNLGALYVATKRFAEAEAAFRQALAADPVNVDSRHSLGMLVMGEGRYAEGWPLMEARRLVPALKIIQPTVGCPEWRGEDLTGKRLLVYPEQGFGDHIQYFRAAVETSRARRPGDPGLSGPSRAAVRGVRRRHRALDQRLRHPGRGLLEPDLQRRPAYGDHP